MMGIIGEEGGREGEREGEREGGKVWVHATISSSSTLNSSLRFLTKNNGVLFENDILQIGIKAEYKKNLGEVSGGRRVGGGGGDRGEDHLVRAG